MSRFLALGLLLLLAAPALAQAPTPLDGRWKGRSDGGTCNAPLDYDLVIDTGLVDGSAIDSLAHSPAPNLKKGPAPPPMPGLWQIHGVAKPGTFTLLAVASVQATDRRGNRLTVKAEGDTLTITENSGCGRTARLTRG
jgi:hypothetical protein